MFKEVVAIIERKKRLLIKLTDEKRRATNVIRKVTLRTIVSQM